MMMRPVMGAVMAVLVGVACVAQADDIEAAKARRKERNAQITQILKAGDASEGGRLSRGEKPVLMQPRPGG